jgi:hypothetical protein
MVFCFCFSNHYIVKNNKTILLLSSTLCARRVAWVPVLCDLSESISFMAVTFRNYYLILAFFSQSLIVISVYLRFLCAKERCGRLHRVTGSCDRTGDGNKSRVGRW